MKIKIIIFLLSSFYLSYSQSSNTGEETFVAPNGGPGQYFCYLGQANRPPTPGFLTCNCKWEWIQYHTNVFPCYPFNGMQLVYEENFNAVNQVRPPYSSAPFQSYDEQVIYRDWRRGYGYNGANGTDPNKTSWDDDTMNIKVQNGNLDLTAKQYSFPYHNYSDNSVFQSQYTGGTIITEDKWGYGEFEIRCKMAADPEGLNHAFWLTGGTLDGCTKEEIDVFETFDDLQNTQSYNDASPFVQQKNRRIKTTIYSSPCDNDNARCERYLHTKLPPGQYLSDWHTFKLAWTPYETSLFVDGQFIYKMFSFGLGLFQTNPIQQGTGCNIMSTTADAVDAIAGTFPSWWPPALIPQYHVKRMKTYPRAEHSTMHLLVQNAVRVGSGQHLNLPQQMEVDYVKIWQFGDCQTDVVKTGLYSNGCNKDAPYVNYHMGHNITYTTNFLLSAVNQCAPTNDNNYNYLNRRLIACASNEIIFEPGSTFEYGTNFETRIQPCTPITNSSGIAPPIGMFRPGSSAPSGYPNLRDTMINGQYALYEPENMNEGFAGDEIIAGNGIEVTPNPASNEVVLQSNFTTGLYEITGSYGEKIKAGEIHDYKERIDITALKDGVYYVKFTHGAETKQTRFIKISK